MFFYIWTILGLKQKKKANSCFDPGISLRCWLCVTGVSLQPQQTSKKTVLDLLQTLSNPLLPLTNHRLMEMKMRSRSDQEGIKVFLAALHVSSGLSVQTGVDCISLQNVNWLPANPLRWVTWRDLRCGGKSPPLISCSFSWFPVCDPVWSSVP